MPALASVVAVLDQVKLCPTSAAPDAKALQLRIPQERILIISLQGLNRPQGYASLPFD